MGLGYRLEQSQPAEPLMDSTTMHPHTDRKTLRKKQQKKIAQGHAEDDHEEEQTWQQTMCIFFLCKEENTGEEMTAHCAWK